MLLSEIVGLIIAVPLAVIVLSMCSVFGIRLAEYVLDKEE